jgi:hypothetical protein
MGILTNQRIILSCFIGKTAAKTKYVEYDKKLLKYHLFLSTLVSDMFPFSSFVSSKAQTVHLYSLK